MSGINSIVGINQVGVDYRPEPGQVENTGKSAVGGEPQKLEGVNDVGSILRRMDVLLMNAAQRFVTTNIENQVRHALAAKVGNKKNSADFRTSPPESRDGKVSDGGPPPDLGVFV